MPDRIGPSNANVPRPQPTEGQAGANPGISNPGVVTGSAPVTTPNGIHQPDAGSPAQAQGYEGWPCASESEIHSKNVERGMTENLNRFKVQQAQGGAERAGQAHGANAGDPEIDEDELQL